MGQLKDNLPSKTVKSLEELKRNLPDVREVENPLDRPVRQQELKSLSLHSYIGKILRTQVNTGGSAFDADASTFFNAGTFNDALKTAYNTFFLNLKTGLTNGTNVFSDLIALYILTSENAADNAINAKNPGTFNLTFVNSPTHASTGVTFNGTNQYARTGLIPSTDTTLNSVTLSTYQVNDVDQNARAISAQNSTSQKLSLTPQLSNLVYFDCYNTTTGRSTYSNTVSTELITATRRGSTDAQAYRNATSLGTNTGASGNNPPSVELYLAANNNAGSPDLYLGNEYRIAMIGNGMTTAQVQDWSAAVTQLMTDLGI